MRSFLYLCVLAPGIALAQARAVDNPPPLPLDEAVTLAVRQNPRLAAAAREMAAAQAGVRSARALTNPSITFAPSVLGTGGSGEELLAQQPLELNGTRSARAGVARAQLRGVEARSVVELRGVVAETKSAYFGLARAQELRTVAAEVLRSTEEFDRGVRRQAEEGLRPGIDPTQTAVEVARARRQLTLAESEVRTAQAGLNTLLGRLPEQPIAAVTPIPFSPEGEPAADLVERALAARAEIQSEAALRDQARQEGRLARAEGRPDLTPQFRAGSVTRGFGDSGVGLGISLPFLDWGSRRNRIRQAEETARAQEARIEAARNQVRSEVAQALARLRAAEEVVRSYQGGTLQQSRQLLDASLKGLQLGAPNATLLSALEAQRTYRAVLTEYTEALAAHARAQAELERATGAVPESLLSRVPAEPAAQTGVQP